MQIVVPILYYHIFERMSRGDGDLCGGRVICSLRERDISSMRYALRHDIFRRGEMFHCNAVNLRVDSIAACRRATVGSQAQKKQDRPRWGILPDLYLGLFHIIFKSIIMHIFKEITKP